jgi:hypothetical protein
LTGRKSKAPFSRAMKPSRLVPMKTEAFMGLLQGLKPASFRDFTRRKRRSST